VISLYVHVPFCASRCPYCDFATAPATSALRGRYLRALEAEIVREGAALGRPRVATAFFGGGTPSLLEPDEIAALGAAISAAFDFRPDEVTFEANPATLDRARLEAWRALGTTRVSLGAQSFSSRALAALGRTHTPEDIAPAVAAARSIGLDVSLDLIFGRPDEPDGEWRADLDAAIGLEPDHISAYPLELALEPEEGGANWGGGGWPTIERWRTAAAAAQPDDDGQADRYELASEVLRSAGYRHYEIANWARPGNECRHNLVYWRNGEWLGVGTGAHSHLAGQRSRHPGAVLEYVSRIERGLGRIPDDGADLAVDTAILALRLDEGLDLAAYAVRFGAPARARVDAALSGLDRTGVLERRGDRVALSDRGRFVANDVFVRLLG
jgi:oxygen-independent coproporphyrinogen-3 oxidase